MSYSFYNIFFFSSRRRHTRLQGDWSSDVCSSDLLRLDALIPTPLWSLLPITVEKAKGCRPSPAGGDDDERRRSEEHTSELQSPCNLVCRLLLEKKKNSEYYSTPG